MSFVSMFCRFVDVIVYKVQMSNVGLCACIYLQGDMCINVKKSVSIRFGPKFNADCVELGSKFGGNLQWVTSCRYLGILFVNGRTLKCDFCNAKSQYFFGHLMRSMAKLDVLPLKNVY